MPPPLESRPLGIPKKVKQLQALKHFLINREILAQQRLLLSLVRVCNLPRSGAACKRDSLDNLLISIGLHIQFHP
jgi:hypothetical protein